MARGGDKRIAELRAEIQRLRDLVTTSEDMAPLVHEMRVHQEEIRVQQAQLLEARSEIEASRDRYAELFDFAPVAYVVLDANGTIRNVNMTAVALMNSIRQRLTDSPFVVHVAGPDRRRFLDHMVRCRRSQGRVETELELAPDGGAPRPVVLTSRPFHERSAGVTSYNTAIFDLTDQRRAAEERLTVERERQRIGREEQAARASAEARDRFLAVLSHELRTPLSPALLVAERLARRGDLDPEIRDALEVIRRNIGLEARLIDDLLDVTRVLRNRLRLTLRPLDVHELVDDVLAICREEAQRSGVDLRGRLEARKHNVRGDAGRLRQALWNLVQNAVRHTPRGGVVTIATSDDEAGSVRLSVRDTGVGIEESQLERIFRPFEQVDPNDPRAGSLGLGLTICRGIVEAHGGALRAASAGLNRGAEFTIEIPTTAESVESPAPRTAAMLPAPQPCGSILLVEDHPDTAEALTLLLEQRGYRVLLAATQRDALSVEDPYDLLVSDLGLPDGSGLELMRTLRQRRPVKAIALSGYGTEKDVQQATEAGFMMHLTKPVDVDKLLAAIARACA